MFPKRNYWRVKYWGRDHNSPNSPIFSHSKIFPRTVLNDLLHKDVKWDWTKNILRQWKLVIKTALTSTETLSHYDQQLPLSLACDASSVGVGAVIFHTLPNGQEKPIAYAPRKLTHAERNYAQIQKEALAIIYGVQKF